MEVTMSPELARKLTDAVADTGRSVQDLVEDAVKGFLDELSTLRSTLDSRYDDLASGRIAAIDAEEARRRLRARSADHRSRG
jgi:Arc/MetJ-type ribon-helix-helix transcriptional regulator